MIRMLAAVARSALPVAALAILLALPQLALAQASPFLTGATALESNILAWLTPIAIILVMVLGAMAMANRIVENCGNTLILRCSASERGGTSQFASRLIGEHQVVRRSSSRGRDGMGGFGQGARGARRSLHLSEQQVIEAAVLAAEVEQLPDFAGFVKTAASPVWLKVRLGRAQ